MILRGPSGSGKTSTARAVRERLGRKVAWVEQDQVRRILLSEGDVSGGINIGLIDTTVRYCLDNGYHVILDGMLVTHRYGDMLTQLIADHRGHTLCYWFDVSFDETVRRHATRPQRTRFTPEEMRPWYRHRDLLAGDVEILIPEDQDLAGTVERLLTDLALPTLSED
ncbi:MAG: hypothetical protein QG622_2764 [Actinomycetota bacterium]|nr:hypothetical protein [Actinomycetota bacterium]